MVNKKKLQTYCPTRDCGSSLPTPITSYSQTEHHLCKGDYKEREDLLSVNRQERIDKLFRLGLPDEQRYIEFYYGREIKVLSNEEIVNLTKFYKTKFNNLCIEKARDIRRLIIEEYGKKIRGLKCVHLSSLFSFRVHDCLDKVERRDHTALTEYTLNRIKSEINEYKNTHITLVNSYKDSFDKIFKFIDKHIIFSRTIYRKKNLFKIKFKEGSTKLEAKSFLYENIRYAFPKKDGFPINNTLLSTFLFDNPFEYKERTRIDADLWSKNAIKRVYLSNLLIFDYRVSKLKIEDFREKGIYITEDSLETLRQDVSFIIYYFIFNKFYKSSYVSRTTSKGQEVGRYYWTPEYFVIRAIFFAVAESNNGRPLTFKEIKRDIGIDLKHHLYDGFGFTESYQDLNRYLIDLTNNRPQNSDIDIFRNAQQILEEYSKIYYTRRKARKDSLGEYDSEFEREVHLFLQREITPLFIHDKAVVDAVGKKEIILIDEDGNEMIRKIHSLLHYDYYLKLTGEIRKCLGLDTKWRAIAVEAQGEYWHNMIGHIERDRFKQTISTQENIILLKIWDNMKSDIWFQQFITQLEKQTGIEISQDKISKLKNYLSNS